MNTGYHAGRVRATDRRILVARLTRQRCRTKDIARQLGITPRRVQQIRAEIRKALAS